MNTRIITNLVLAIVFITVLGMIGRNDYNDRMEELGHSELKIK
jgi:hypothetical protein